MKLEVEIDDTAEYGMVGKILGKVVIAPSTEVGSSKGLLEGGDCRGSTTGMGECPA